MHRTVCTVHKLADLGDATKRMLVVMVEPGEKLGRLARVCCVDPDCHVTGLSRVVINSILLERSREVRPYEFCSEHSLFLQTAAQGRNVTVLSSLCSYSKGLQFGRRMRQVD